jgi:AcrR family transcriptional regulator
MSQRRRTQRRRRLNTEEVPAPAAGPSSSARRQEIVRLAGELFSEQGYANTTVRDIADRAGILSGSLYWHFEAKEDIVFELLRDFIDHLLWRYNEILDTAPTPLDALRSMLTAAVEALGSYHAAANILQSEKSWLYELERFAFVPEGAEEVRRIWSDVLTQCVADGSVRSDIDVELTFRFLRDGVWSIARWYGQDKRDLEDVARRFVDHNMVGIVGEAHVAPRR